MLLATLSSRELLATAADGLGRDAFYSGMMGYLSSLFGDLNGLVIRYHKSACPEMLVNQVLDDKVQDIYLGGLYALDPLNNVTRANFSAGVYSFNESFEIDSDKIKYQEAVFKHALISDELAWLVMMPDASMLAFCLDKPNGYFASEEIQLARAELPIVKALAGKHFELEFVSKLKERTGVVSQVERIVHLDREQNIESQRWRMEFSALSDQDKAALEQAALEVRGDGGYREVFLESERVASNCIVALDGEHYLQQRIRPRNKVSDEYYKGIIDNALEAFLLSGREHEVVFLSLLGYPNSIIANKLKISSGTVKNHKYSIYNKLDITSERELFNLVLKSIVGANMHDDLT